MKSKLKKIIKYIIVLLTLLLAALILYSVTVYEKNYPEFSSYSADNTGVKALYLLAKKCGFQVSRYHYPAKFLDEDAVMVSYRPAEMIFNESEEQSGIKNWLDKGNTLVLILDERNAVELWIFELISQTRKWHEVESFGDITATWYGLENGTICVLNSADEFLNENISSSDASIAFIKILMELNNPKVLFNEYYQYMQVPAPNIWHLLGSTGQLVVIQLMLVILLVGVRGWKPFGRVRGDSRMTKRPENEVVKAISGLYQRMRAYPLVLSNYYGYFTTKYGRYLQISGPIQKKAVRTLAECEYYMNTKKISKKELSSIVRRLDRLEIEINGSMQKK